MNTITKFLMFSIIIVGCKGDKGADGKSAEILKGSISGFVALADSNGIKMKDNRGATISIDGTNYRAESDSIGKWIIKDVPAGIYILTISKPGYSAYKIRHSFVGGGDDFLYFHMIGKLPTFQISNLFVEHTTNNQNVIVNASLSSSTAENVIIYFNRSSKVSSDPADNIGYVFATSKVVGTTNTLSSVIYLPVWQNMDVSSGTKIFLRVYPNVKSGYNMFIDSETGKGIYLSLGPNPSAIDSLIVP